MNASKDELSENSRCAQQLDASHLKASKLIQLNQAFISLLQLTQLTIQDELLCAKIATVFGNSHQILSVQYFVSIEHHFVKHFNQMNGVVNIFNLKK
jgi:hypothetical protein